MTTSRLQTRNKAATFPRIRIAAPFGFGPLLLLALLLLSTPLAACSEETPGSEARATIGAIRDRMLAAIKQGQGIDKTTRVQELIPPNELAGSYFSADDYRLIATNNPNLWIIHCESNSRGWVYEGRVLFPEGKLTVENLTPPRTWNQVLKDEWGWLLVALWLIVPPLLQAISYFRRGDEGKFWPWLAASSLWVFFWSLLPGLVLMPCPSPMRDVAGYTLAVSGSIFLFACIAMPPTSMERAFLQFAANFILALISGAVSGGAFGSSMVALLAVLLTFCVLTCLTLQRWSVAFGPGAPHGARP